METYRYSAQILSDGHLSVPLVAFIKLNLKKGEEVEVVLIKESDKVLKSQIDESSLLLQQKSLGKIWDNPEEDIYEL
ncbi:hypothetical protein KJ693_07305 [bacterium]|nr:hypothetical protein [bacterium]